MSRHSYTTAVDWSKPSEWAVLAGAGISARSGLPIATTLVQAIAEELFPGDDVLQKAVIASRFETLLEVLEATLGGVRSLLNVFATAKPNPNHELLASFVQAGAMVFTTNFDGLIEQRLDRSYRAFHKAPKEEDLVPGVYGVHGTVGATDGASAPVATLDGLARIRHDLAWRQFVTASFSARNLLVVGYSGADDFDLVPWMSERTGSRSTVWSWHADDLAPTEIPTSEVLDGPRQPAQLLVSWQRSGRADLARRCQVLKGDARELLREAHQSWFDSLPAPTTSDHPDYKVRSRRVALGAVRKWCAPSTLRPLQRERLAGEILASMGNHSDAIARYRIALSLPIEQSDRCDRVETLAALSESETQLRKPDYVSANVNAAAVRRAPSASPNALRRAGSVLDRCAFLADRLGPELKDVFRVKVLSPGATRFEVMSHLDLLRKRCRRADEVMGERAESLADLSALFSRVCTEHPDLEAEAMLHHELGKWTERWEVGTDVSHLQAVKTAAWHVREALRLRLALEKYADAGASENVLATLVMKFADWNSWVSGVAVDLSFARRECDQMLKRNSASEWDRFNALLMQSTLAVRGEYGDTKAARSIVARDALATAEKKCGTDPLDNARTLAQAGLIEVAFGTQEAAGAPLRDARHLVASAQSAPAKLLRSLVDFWLGVLSGKSQSVSMVVPERHSYHFRRCQMLLEELERARPLEAVATHTPWLLVDFRP